MSVLLRVAGPHDYEWMEHAVQACPDSRLEFGGFYGSATSKLAALAVGAREVLMMVEDCQVVGFVDADPDPDFADTLHVGYFVAREHRGRSHATRALVLLGSIRPKWRLVAAVRPTNGASLATARAAGFIEIGQDPWGELLLQRPPNDPSMPL